MPVSLGGSNGVVKASKDSSEIIVAFYREPYRIVTHLLESSRVFRIFFSIILLACLITFSFVTSYADAGKVFRENSKAVVVIETYDKEGKLVNQGSGFVVRQDGAIVTNYHVISNADKVKVRSGEIVSNVEGLLHIDKENDIVILKVKADKLHTVNVGDIGKLNVGEKVYVISSPKGLENTISEGILSGIREIDTEKKILQITAPVSEGSSGGPVFDKNGEVIGIATFLIKEAQNLNFAMPINLIKHKISARIVTALKDAEIKEYKESAEYWLVLGYYYKEAKLYEEAIKAYKRAISIKPDFAEAYNFLGHVYIDLGMNREAIEEFKKSIKIKPNVSAYCNLGHAYINLHMSREAIEACNKALEIEPDYYLAHFCLGRSYVELHTSKEAIDAFKKTIRIKPDFIYAYESLGVLYGLLERYEEATDILKQELMIDPNRESAYFWLGKNYHLAKKYNEAISAYKKALQINPDYADAQFELGRSYLSFAQFEPGRSYSALSGLILSLDLYKEGIEAMKQAIRINPDNAEYHYALGLSYLNIRDYDKSAESFRQAIRLKPDYIDAHYALGLYYLALGDKGSTLEEYKILKTLNLQKANELFNAIYE